MVVDSWTVRRRRRRRRRIRPLSATAFFLLFCCGCLSSSSSSSTAGTTLLLLPPLPALAFQQQQRRRDHHRRHFPAAAAPPSSSSSSSSSSSCSPLMARSRRRRRRSSHDDSRGRRQQQRPRVNHHRHRRLDGSNTDDDNGDVDVVDDGYDSDSDSDDNDNDHPLWTVVVVGGGWAGFTVADALAAAATARDDSNNDKRKRKTKKQLQLHLLDASPRGPGGLAGGWRTPRNNLPVEAGVHGFWRDYRNTFDTIENRIGLSLDAVLTPYTPSQLVSASGGRVALAPVMGDTGGDDKHNSNNNNNSNDTNSNPPLLSKLLQLSPKDSAAQQQQLQQLLLPPPLDLAVQAEFDPGNPLTAVDRLSAVNLAYCWADFVPDSLESWHRYDSISAESLFRPLITETLYEQLAAPLLHVLPMAPGYDCSAAAALSCFHCFALAARGSFDVRWCRGGISTQLFDPWVRRLQQLSQQQPERLDLRIRGSARVTRIAENDSNNKNKNNNTSRKKYTVEVSSSNSSSNETTATIDCDAVILAVGATAAGRLIDACPPLLAVPHLRDQWKRWRGVTCVAVRLFFRNNDSNGNGNDHNRKNSNNTNASLRAVRAAMRDAGAPVFVCGPKLLPALVETGFCVYGLGQLQDADPDVANSIEVDYFRANALANMKDDNAVIELTLRALEAALGLPEHSVQSKDLADAAVVRARNAVSHFDVGSAARSPPVRLLADGSGGGGGIYACGDWVDRTGHASWSTEKAVVTGRQAAAAAAQDLGLLEHHHNDEVVDAMRVIPAPSDGPALAALRKIAQALRPVAPAIQQQPPPPGGRRRTFPPRPRPF